MNVYFLNGLQMCRLGSAPLFTGVSDRRRARFVCLVLFCFVFFFLSLNFPSPPFVWSDYPCKETCSFCGGVGDGSGGLQVTGNWAEAWRGKEVECARAQMCVDACVC